MSAQPDIRLIRWSSVACRADSPAAHDLAANGWTIVSAPNQWGAVLVELPITECTCNNSGECHHCVATELRRGIDGKR